MSSPRLQQLRDWWTAGHAAAEADAEIREELELHLAMRTEDNMAAGMPPAEARRDARRRFGDFEHNLQACRRATLGPAILAARLRTAAVLLLVVAALAEGVALVRLEADSRRRIDALAEQVQQLQADQPPVEARAPMAYATMTDSHRDAWPAAPGEIPADWGAAVASAVGSDWRALPHAAATN